MRQKRGAFSSFAYIFNKIMPIKCIASYWHKEAFMLYKPGISGNILHRLNAAMMNCMNGISNGL
jgi:hypothetical protein